MLDIDEILETRPAVQAAIETRIGKRPHGKWLDVRYSHANVWEVWQPTDTGWNRIAAYRWDGDTLTPLK